MEKLILRHHWGGEPCGGTENICFEYESKDKFVFDILEKYKKHKWRYYDNDTSDYMTNTVEVLGMSLTKGELEDIEGNIMTLNEWFEFNKEKYDI